MKCLRIVLLSLLSLSLAQGVVAGKVYTWTDDQGTTHYGERPPKDTKATRINPRTGHSDPTPAQAITSGTTSSAPSVAADATPPAPTKNPESCATARKNLQMLNSVARIKIPDEKGNLQFLTEEDKAKQREAMQLIVDQNCD